MLEVQLSEGVCLRIPESTTNLNYGVRHEDKTVTSAQQPKLMSSNELISAIQAVRDSINQTNTIIESREERFAKG